MQKKIAQWGRVEGEVILYSKFNVLKKDPMFEYQISWDVDETLIVY